MKKVTKVFVGAIALISAAAQVPGVSDAVKVLVAAHPHSVLAGLGAVLFAALLHNPNSSN